MIGDQNYHDGYTNLGWDGMRYPAMPSETDADLIRKARDVAKVTAAYATELPRLLNSLATRLELALLRLDDWAPVIEAVGGFKPEGD